MRDLAARANRRALVPVPKGANGEFALCEPAIYRAREGGLPRGRTIGVPLITQRTASPF
jgi:hypothetical protein